MKFRTFPVLILVGACVVSLRADLSPPPGAPGPVMKPLDQIEPRIPISVLPYTITEPGSYYLTGNLVSESNQSEPYGISVEADDVSIDMMGFTLLGAGIGSGISGRDVANLVIGNGSIYWFQTGVNFLSDSFTGGEIGRSSVILHDMRFQFNNEHGIALSGTAIIRDSIIFRNRADGVQSDGVLRIERSLITGNSGHGVFSRGRASDLTVVDSQVRHNGKTGITLIGGTVRECVVSGNGDHGISFRAGWANGRVYQCLVSGNAGAGIFVAPDEYGFWAAAPAATQPPRHGVRIEENQVSQNNEGIRVVAPGGLVLRNVAGDNTLGNYHIDDGVHAGPVGTMEEVGDNPWANLEF